jgi:hypothetical protein
VREVEPFIACLATIRGGLRADILDDGALRVGDVVRVR